MLCHYYQFGTRIRYHRARDSPGRGIEAFNIDGANVVAALRVARHVDDFPDAELSCVLLLFQLPLNRFQTYATINRQ